ncbi:hypothetical protein PHISP_05249 [Aspergillus sp. HF37]|nr:hypothetical protein PHISP_05249 [Aspergillus sp. HF37]
MSPLGHLLPSDTPTETNGFLLQNSLGDYDDIPLVPPGGNDGFWLDAANLLQETDPDRSTSKGAGDTAPDPHQAPNTAPNEDMRFFREDPRASNFRSQLLERAAAHVPRGYRDKSTVSHYPHAATLMSVIEYLEAHSQLARLPIDQAMRSNHDAMTKVRAVIDTEEFRRCQSCPSLVATIMDLVVSLYELVILSIESPASVDGLVSWPASARGPDEMGDPFGESNRGPSSVGGGKERPLFQFGCLEFDADEQEIFRNAMVRRDLGRYIDTIQHCSREIQQRQSRAAEPNGGDFNSGGLRVTRSGTDRAQLQWYQEMKHQATGLLTSLPAKCGHGKESS